MKDTNNLPNKELTLGKTAAALYITILLVFMLVGTSVYGVLCMEFDIEENVRHLAGLIRTYIIISLFASLLITALIMFFYRRLKNANDIAKNVNDDITLRLDVILDGISGGFEIVREDEDFSYHYISEAVAAIQGYTVKELREVSGGKAINNVYPPDLPSTYAALEEQLASGDTYTCKYRVVHKDGSLRWVIGTGKRIRTEDGKVLHYSLYQDVSEFEEQNRHLRNTLTMLNQIITSFNAGIVAYTTQTHEMLIINDEAKRIIGAEGEVSSEKFKEYLRKNVMPGNSHVISRMQSKLRQPGDGTDYVLTIPQNDSSQIIIQVYTKLLQFEDGTQFILSSMQDITEQAKLNSMLRQERTQYRDALTNKCEYSYSFDVTEGQIHSEFVTSQGFNLIRALGLTTPVEYDVLNQKWIEEQKPHFLSEEMTRYLKCDAIIEEFEKGERTIEIEYYNPQRDVYTRITSLLSENEENGHILDFIVATDTTEMRKREAQKTQELLDAKKALEVAYEAARHASTAKSDFLANMSHDIRTPMNAIIGMTAIAGTHLDDSERVADCLAKISVSSKHLLGLINEVLDMSKIESGKVDLAEEDFSLQELVDTTIALSKPQIEAKQHTLIVLAHRIEHEMVVGDGQRLQQVLLNLMSNAVKYTPNGGKIQLSISEKPARVPLFGCYEIVLEDNGIGMSQEFQEHLFEPFARADDAYVGHITGTGLGMAIAKNIVQMMNGAIQVESEPGKGTKFTVTIFLRLKDTKEPISYEELVDLPVLVVDDSQASCEIACEMLDELGMDGEWVLSGKEAVARVCDRHASEDDFFAVIVDWKMPEMDGVETTREIRKKVGNDVPIIIISAYDWSDIEAEARAAGATAFINKPLFKSRVGHLFKELFSGKTNEMPDISLTQLSDENFEGRRALLVEDNELNMEIAQEILSMAGLEIDCAQNGKEAVDVIAAADDDYYDVIFMDVRMPIMNGYEATRNIRAMPREYAKRVPIIAMTANAFSDDIRESKAAGMNEHITKPLDFDRLTQVLKEWVKPRQ